MAGLVTLATGAHDYFFRQGTDADALAAELATPEQRRRYIATFYSSRFWAHPGAFDDEAIAFHAEPFGDGDKLRASFGAYESVFDSAAAQRAAAAGRQPGRCAAPSCSARPTTSSHRTSTGWRRWCSPITSGPFLLRDCGHFVPWEAPHALVSTIVSLAGRAGSQ